MWSTQELAAALAEPTTFVETRNLFLQVLDTTIGVTLPLSSSLSTELIFTWFVAGVP